MVFGNYLKKKAEGYTGDNFAGIGRGDVSTDTETPVIIPPSENGAGSSVSVAGLCVPLTVEAPSTGDPNGDGTVTGNPDNDDNNDSDTSFEARLTRAAEGRTAVLIPLTGEDGYLLYNSQRACEASRLPENPALPGMEELSAAVSAAKSKGLRVCAYIKSGVSLASAEAEYEAAVTADSRIAADAAEAGFDEVIICSLVLSPEDITGEASHIILRYLNQMAAAAGTVAIGLSLPPEVYLTATLSPQIELFASRSVFLTMELTREQSTSEYLSYILENLAGTLSVYNMRMLISPSDTDAGNSFVEKLKSAGHENYLYICVPEESAAPNVPETDPPSTDEPPVTGNDDNV